MICPYYGGNWKCELQSSDYLVPQSHILSHCISPSVNSPKYKSCPTFIQFSPRKTSTALRETVLEMKAVDLEDPNPMATFEGHTEDYQGLPD